MVEYYKAPAKLVHSNFCSFLIVNADDYGMTEAISNGILRSIHKGIVSSVSMVVNTPFFEIAAREIKDLDVDVGVHLSLNGGKSLTINSKTPFTDDNGNFFLWPFNKTPIPFFRLNKKSQNLLKSEFRAQIDKFLEAGLEISHLDSHFHFHVLPSITPVIKDIIEEYNIKYIRFPFIESIWSTINKPTYFVLSILAKRAANILCRRPIRFYGLLETGTCCKGNKNIYVNLIDKIEPGVGELMLHPGYNSDENKKYYTLPLEHIENELKFALSEETKKMMKNNRIQIIRRRDI
jgi:predicted glycoside hydrolase/deacetylase ChbG (UPF0249 family)